MSFVSTLHPTFSARAGKLFMGGPAGHQFPVVHVWGTPYEMGVAQGLLLKASVTAFVNQTLTYIITQARTRVWGVLRVFLAAKLFIPASTFATSTRKYPSAPHEYALSAFSSTISIAPLPLIRIVIVAALIFSLSTQAVDAWPSDFFSPAIKALIVEFGIDVALDWNAGVTAPFTPQVRFLFSFTSVLQYTSHTT